MGSQGSHGPATAKGKSKYKAGSWGGGELCSHAVGPGYGIDRSPIKEMHCVMQESVL